MLLQQRTWEARKEVLKQRKPIQWREGSTNRVALSPSSSSTYAPVPDPAGRAVFWVFPPRGTGAAADLEGGLRPHHKSLSTASGGCGGGPWANGSGQGQVGPYGGGPWIARRVERDNGKDNHMT